MNPLTADEMACVAKEVTGFEYWVDGDGNIRCRDVSVDSGMMFWKPSFKAAHGIADFRSQALALVEWLCKQVPLRTTARYIELVDAINNKDTTALQRMVLELRNPQ